MLMDYKSGYMKILFPYSRSGAFPNIGSAYEVDGVPRILNVFAGEWYGGSWGKKTSLTKTYRSSHFMLDFVSRSTYIACSEKLFHVWIAFFCTFKVVTEEWY